MAFCEQNQIVVLNDEHTEYWWCGLSEAKALAPFSNQRKLYDFVWKNFVLQKPEAMLEIK